MKVEILENVHQAMRVKGISFGKGLTHREIALIEDRFEVVIPPDLRAFLEMGQPESSGFVQWRYGLNDADAAEAIKKRILWPFTGMLFDIRNNSFWLEAWGPKPPDPASQREIAFGHFQTYPQLVPIFLDRFIPGDPPEPDNPVFSVYQMDIIYYGMNLPDYFNKEFDLGLPLGKPKSPKSIPFWKTWAEE